MPLNPATIEERAALAQANIEKARANAEKAREISWASEKAFTSAIDALFRAIKDEMRTECNALTLSTGSHTAADAYLMDQAYSNRSTWSGGPGSASNVTELARREIAVCMMRDRQRDREITNRHTTRPAPEAMFEALRDIVGTLSDRNCSTTDEMIRAVLSARDLALKLTQGR
jgi:hypothetical protein